jgi:hypothetical protein
LTPINVPESQRWTLQEPHKSHIEKGLAWAAKTEPKETNLGELLNVEYLQSLNVILSEWNSPNDEAYNLLTGDAKQ